MYTNILDKKRKLIWYSLKYFRSSFVLGGGSALALLLNHRVSYDFDLFTERTLEPNLLDKIKSLNTSSEVKLLVQTGEELTILLDDVKVTFLYFPFKSLFPSLTSESIPIKDVKDIAADKAYTLGRRGVWRDYYDIYTILERGILNLEEVINLSQKKFKGLFNEKLFLGQLTYFDDIKDFSITPVSGKKIVNEEKVKRFLEKQAANYVANI